MSWFKRAFRGNIPRINDMDEALNNPYKHKEFDDTRGVELNTPGGQDGTGFGADYYPKRQPPKNTQQTEDRAIQETFGTDYDGNDPNRSPDEKNTMTNGDAFYDTDSPIGPKGITSLNRPDMDNTAVGPHNMSNKNRRFFDNISKRIS